MEKKPEKCLICQQTKEKYIYNLNQPICSDCWKDPVALKKTHTPEIVQITDKLFLGNADAQIDKTNLQNLGITHIITVGKELQPLHPEDFVYKHIKIFDFPFEDISQYFSDVFDFIEESGITFIHCLQGKSRSGSLVLSYLMKKNKWNLQKSMEFVKEKRNIQPNPGFWKQLNEYELSLSQQK